jgi:hypothetical protein
MKVSLSRFVENNLEYLDPNENINTAKVQLVLGFGSRQLLETKPVYNTLSTIYPSAQIVLCSTAGEIFNDKVYDDSVSITAIEFDKTVVSTHSVEIDNFSDSYKAGKALINQVNFNDLSYILIISDGGKVNGSELVRAVNEEVQNRVPVTGGLAGDGTSFQSTLVGLNGKPVSGKIVAIAFYGKNLKITHGSMGGWEIFGLERKVTKSVANKLFEIEGEKALDLYKTYLGKYANELPGSALLFPLAVKINGNSEPVVRTILSIDNESGSMTFAGDIPEGASVRFMRANFDKLIDAATGAASQSVDKAMKQQPKLALLISCVGRKIILGSRTEEEVEAVSEAFDNKTLITGFYSYGEISPFSKNTKCELHNQTMTITTFDEQ